MKIYILLVAIVVAACVSIPAHAPRDVASLEPAKQLTFAKLRDAIVSNKFSSVEQTLAYLNKNYGDYLSYHTLQGFNIGAGNFFDLGRALLMTPMFTPEEQAELKNGVIVEDDEQYDRAVCDKIAERAKTLN